MAHKKAGGSTQLGRDSESKRLGVKIYGDQPVKAGQVILRQRGSKYRAGEGVRVGSDDTLYASITGTVKFIRSKAMRFTGSLKKITTIKVEV